MKADSIKLVEFLSENKTLFKIPVYQRNYEWDTRQCAVLFQDLELAIENDLAHFMGPMVYVSQSGPHMSRIHIIIDGQQRLTSLMLLLKALRDSTDDTDFQLEIENQFLINQYLSNLNDGVKLEQVDYDQTDFQNVIHNQLDDSMTTDSKIINNYRYFKQLIKDSPYSVTELHDGLELLNMVYIELSTTHDDENPQVIFESLNSKGISLTYSDLIRNFLLMPLPDDEQTKLYHQYWAKIQQVIPNEDFNTFIQNYLLRMRAPFKRNRSLYDNYQVFFYHENLNSEKALKSLYQFSINYSKFMTCHTEDDQLNASLVHINVLLKNKLYPYLLLVYLNYLDGKYSMLELQKLFKLVETYAFRHRLISNHNLSATSMRALVKPIDDDGTIEYQRLAQAFIQYGMPDDNTLRKALLTQRLYWSSRSAYVVKQILSVFESYYSKELVDLTQTQIEHILPQQLNPEWKNSIENANKVNEVLGDTIGNLTLTMYNQEMSNKSFRDKLEYYETSNIYITRQIASMYDHWDASTIRQRGNQIADVLIETYPMPVIDNELKFDLD